MNNDKYPGSSGSLTAEVDASSVTPGSMVIMYSNGSFSYLPPVGFTGTDTFDYTLTDSSGFFDTGTVSINVSQMIWYVNENNMETADGRSGSPFQSLDPLDIDGSADELDRAGDTIFLFRGTGYTSDGFNLENSQVLHGNGLDLDFSGFTYAAGSVLVPKSISPIIEGDANDVIYLSDGNTIRGLDLSTTNGYGIYGSGFVDGVSIEQVGITCTGSGKGVRLNSCSGTVSINGLEVTGSFEHGVLLYDGCSENVTIENSTFIDMELNGIHVEMLSDETMDSFQVTNCTFEGTENPAGTGATTDSGIEIILENGSDATNIDITGSKAKNLAKSFVRVYADQNDSGDNSEIDSLNISNNGTNIAPLESKSEVIHVRINGSSTLADFHIDNNIMDGDDGDGFPKLSDSSGIRINTGEFIVGTDSTSSVSGTVNGNIIKDIGSGSTDNGIELQVQENTVMVVDVDGNIIDGVADNGIRARIFDNAEGHVTISNNNLGLTTPNPGGIDVQTRSQITNLSLCLDIYGNNVGSQNYVMRHDAGTFNLYNIGSGIHDAAQVDNFIESLNTGNAASVGGGYTQCLSILRP